MKTKNYTVSQYGRVMSLLVLAIGLTFTSCKKEDEGVVVDTYIDLSFKDADGNDLLSGNTSNAYNQENINIYYLINGEEERAYNEKLDAPKGFSVYEQESQKIMRLFPSDHDENLKTTTFIKFNDAETDEVICELRKWGSSNKSVAVTKVWYNGELVWDGTGPRYIEIVK
jgi:hypothetical protein